MTGERGDTETVLGVCYFCHYFVIQHYITWKMHNCWNLITKKSYLFFQPEYLWLFGECESLMSDGEFGLSEDSIYLLVLPRSFFYVFKYNVFKYITYIIYICINNMITCAKLSLKQMWRLTKAKTKMKCEHWKKRWN